jgi:hypothetical protein
MVLASCRSIMNDYCSEEEFHILCCCGFYTHIRNFCSMVGIAELNNEWADYAAPGGWNGKTHSLDCSTALMIQFLLHCCFIHQPIFRPNHFHVTFFCRS